jgi:hypothetical protein
LREPQKEDLAPFRLPTTLPVSPYQQGGRLPSDWVAAFDRNRWPPSVGISGRFASDSAYGWKFLQVGGFLATWTIAYGGVQAIVPSLVSRSTDGLSREVPAARAWAAILAAVPIALALIMNSTDPARPDLVLVVGLALFGRPFAVNSSLHSYLILAYAGSEKAAEDVGFYDAANAAGRLLGITLSGCFIKSRVLRAA